MDIEISDTLLLAVNHIAQFIATILSIFIARRFLDQRSFTSLGLKLDKKMWIDLFVGIVITFIQMGFIYIIMYALGWISFEGFAWEFESASSVTLNLLGIFGVFILVGWNEELLSRGYHLQNLADGINLTWGVIISSSVFAILHIGNPGATWISTLGLFLAGVFLAYGYIRTKQLWLPIGLHIGWNFFEGVVFGFPVSGLNIFTLTRINIHGPELITGGAFGPEAGLIVIPALVFGMALIYTYSNVGHARSVTPQP
ncbi:MAG: CPBP family intramembrane metalloprotease [Anaerolineae bacterium]|nr:CPBP family intramembrane metalloprotease [Anaerolineae bacterium]MBT7191817.1 CPBP family intramembrane metalloprotease [Anaerolineae bacterium]